MNSDHIDFSSKLSKNRILQAKTIFGAKIINKILAWALFLLGASKPSICEAINMKPGSLRTLLHLIQHKGLSTLESGSGGKTSSFKPVVTEVIPEPLKVSLDDKDDQRQINFGEQLHIQIPTANPLLHKAILLSLLNNQQLTRKAVSESLQISEVHVTRLAKKLAAEDIVGLIDQRRGQQQDYVVTPDVKGEIIQQFVIDVVQDGKVSGEGLSKNLLARCQHQLSPNTILAHMDMMGLSKIKKTLPSLLETIKKNTSTH